MSLFINLLNSDVIHSNQAEYSSLDNSSEREIMQMDVRVSHTHNARRESAAPCNKNTPKPPIYILSLGAACNLILSACSKCMCCTSDVHLRMHIGNDLVHCLLLRRGARAGPAAILSFSLSLIKAARGVMQLWCVYIFESASARCVCTIPFLLTVEKCHASSRYTLWSPPLMSGNRDSQINLCA